MLNMQQKMVVRPDWSSRKRKTIIFMVLLTAISLIVGMYYYGYSKGIRNVEGRELLITDLQNNIADLASAKKDLQKKLTRLEVDRGVQKSAYKDLEKTYERVDQKNEYLNRRVNFYRSILTPKDGVSGVRIHGFKLLKTNDESKLDFELTIIQSIRHDKRANVTVKIELFGEKNSSSSELLWNPETTVYSFRHFEVVTGSLVSSKGDMNDKYIKVTVIPGGDTSKELVEWRKV